MSDWPYIPLEIDQMVYVYRLLFAESGLSSTQADPLSVRAFTDSTHL